MIVSGLATSSAPADYRFAREVIAVAVRWYLRYGLSYRDVEELLAERGIDVDHVTWSTGGCSGSRLSSSMLPGQLGRPRVIAGLSRRPTSRSLAGGSTSTGRSISTVRSSTCWSVCGATPRPRGVLRPRITVRIDAGRGHHR